MAVLRLNSNSNSAMDKAKAAKKAIEQCKKQSMAVFQQQLDWLDVEVDDYISGELDASEYAEHIVRVSNLAIQYSTQIQELARTLREKINNLP